MSDTIVDFCVGVCGERDISCLEKLLYSMRAFTPLESIRLFVVCNKVDPRLEEMTHEVVGDCKFRSISITSFQSSHFVDSKQHGESLDRLISQTTSKFVVLCDSDILILSPHWFKFCLAKIQEGAFAVGTPYPGCPQRINCWCVMLNADEVRRNKISMMPGPISWNGKRWRCDDPLRDTSYQIYEHAARNKRITIPFVLDRAAFSKSLYLFSPDRGAKKFASLMNDSFKPRAGILDFRFPGMSEFACCHLLHVNSIEGRFKWWLENASQIVDYTCALKGPYENPAYPIGWKM